MINLIGEAEVRAPHGRQPPVDRDSVSDLDLSHASHSVWATGITRHATVTPELHSRFYFGKGYLWARDTFGQGIPLEGYLW